MVATVITGRGWRLPSRTHAPEFRGAEPAPLNSSDDKRIRNYLTKKGEVLDFVHRLSRTLLRVFVCVFRSKSLFFFFWGACEKNGKYG